MLNFKFAHWASVALVSLFLAVAACAAPPAPSAVWAQAQVNSTYLAWNIVPGATQYSIYRGTTSGGEAATPIATSVSANYSDTLVTVGKTYYYYVKAQFATSISPASMEASCIPGSTALPAAAMVAQPGPNEVKIYWSPVAGASFYYVDRYDSVLGWTVIAKVVGSAADSYIDTTAVNGNQYSYEVVTANTGGIGGGSSVFMASAGDTPIVAPGGAYATPGYGSITINWNAVPAAIGYVVYRSTTSGTEGLKPYLVINNGNTAFADTLPSNTTMYYKIAALDPSGVGYQSAECFAQSGGTQLAAPIVAATAVSPAVRVEWSAVTGATGYLILRSVGDNTHYGVYTKVASSAQLYTDTAVTAGTRYYYAVAAVDAVGTGLFAAADVKAGAALPAASTGISAQSGVNYINLQWNPVAGVQLYNVYRGTASGLEGLYASGVDSTTYTDSNVSAGTTYYYRVKGVGVTTEGAFSAEVTAEPNVTRLVAPVITASVVAGKATLEIGLVSGATAYNVYRTPNVNNASGTVQIALGLKPAEGTSALAYTDLSALTDVTYTYYATAVNATGEGLASNQVTATPGNAPLAAPTGIIAFATGSNITVQCDPQPSAVNYNVYRSTTPTMSAVPYAVAVGNQFTDQSATPGVLYYYAFTAVDWDGQSALSVLCSANQGSAVLHAPILTLNQGATTNVLIWSAVSGAFGYDVYRAPNNESTNYTMIASNVATPSFTDTAVTVGLQYTYEVFPVATNGAGSVSNRVVGIPGSTRLTAPFGLAANPNSNSIDLHFNPVPNATSYNLYRGTASLGEGLVPISVSNGGTSLQDSNVVVGTVYYYKVTAVDDHGQSLQSTEVSAQAGSTPLVAPTLSLAIVSTAIEPKWSSVPGATSYNLYRAISGGNYVLYKQVTTLDYVDTAIEAGASYYYYVTAVNSNGEGYQSSIQGGHT